jgi:hypothetical protein
MDAIPAGIVNGVGVVAVILIFGGGLIRAIQSGALVTRREADDIAHDRDEWRAAHRISETARVEEREHNAALIEDIAKPMQEFLRAFRQKADDARREADET